MTIGEDSLRERLARAVAEGRLVHQAGIWRLPPGPPGQVHPWLTIANAPPPPCTFLFRFLFTLAYGRAAVPFGCRDCYKVRARPTKLRQLVALHEVAQGLPYCAKIGVVADSDATPAGYWGYFYLNGLDEARAAYRRVRAAIDGHAALGPAVGMVIKRGCTQYEVHCGRSDQFVIDPALAEFEARLWARFAMDPPDRGKDRVIRTLEYWREVARRIGDDAGGGGPAGPPTVTYAARA